MPTISNFQHQPAQSSSTTAVFTWTTDVPATSQVEWAIEPNPASPSVPGSYPNATTLSPAGVTSHRVEVTGLAPQTGYHARAVSADAATGVDPLAVPSIAARWRAEDVAGLSENDPVALWASSAGGLLAQQPVAADRPLYAPGVQNGKAGLAFNGVSAHLNAGDVLGFTGAFTAQFVLKLNDTNAYSMVFTKSNGNDATDTQYEVRRNGTASQLQFNGGPGGTLQAANTATLTLTSYHVYTVVVDPAGTAQWYVDGVASGSAYTWSPSGTFTSTVVDFVIGGRISNGTLQPYAAPMTLLELNLYTGALDAGTRHAIELALGAYYSLSVA